MKNKIATHLLKKTSLVLLQVKKSNCTVNCYAILCSFHKLIHTCQPIRIENMYLYLCIFFHMNAWPFNKLPLTVNTIRSENMKCEETISTNWKTKIFVTCEVKTDFYLSFQTFTSSVYKPSISLKHFWLEKLSPFWVISWVWEIITTWKASLHSWLSEFIIFKQANKLL